MSDNRLSYTTYGIDSSGRIVHIDPGVSNTNIRRLPSIDETLRRLRTNLRSDRQISASNNGEIIRLKMIY